VRRRTYGPILIFSLLSSLSYLLSLIFSLLSSLSYLLSLIFSLLSFFSCFLLLRIRGDADWLAIGTVTYRRSLSSKPKDYNYKLYEELPATNLESIKTVWYQPLRQNTCKAEFLERSDKPPLGSVMLSCSSSVTSSRFRRRLAPGRHDLAFKVVFGSYAAAARFFGVSKMTVWRWCHDRWPLPEDVIRAMPGLLQDRVAAAHAAQAEFRNFLAEPPSGQALHFGHPVQLDDGRIVFVQRRRAKARRRVVAARASRSQR
jgi:hypothetical protein